MVLQSEVNRLEYVKVLPGKWKFSHSEPFPPISTVTAVPFWQSPLFEHLRNTLLKPLSEPSVTFVSEYITIDTVKHTLNQEADKPAEETTESDDEPEDDHAQTEGQVGWFA